MHEKYYDEMTQQVKGWKHIAAPSDRFPYGLGLDNDDFLRTHGIYPVRDEREEFNPMTHELIADQTPTIEDGYAVLHHRATALPSDVSRANLENDIRLERDRRIAGTDYMMASDYPITEDQRLVWGAYRQELRDITAKQGFPWQGASTAPWPVRPDGKEV